MSKASNSHARSKTANQESYFRTVCNELAKSGLFSPAMGGSFSIKTSLPDRIGHEHDVMLFSDVLSSEDSPAILRQDLLEPLIELDALEPGDLQFELDRCRLTLDSSKATVRALYHSAINEKVVCITTHSAFSAIGCVQEWQDLVKKILGAEVLPLPYAPSGFPLLKVLRQAISRLEQCQYKAIYLRHHGLLAFGENPDEIQSLTIELLGHVQEYVKADFKVSASSSIRGQESEESIRIQIADLREKLSERAKRPILLRLSQPNDTEDAAFQLIQEGLASAVVAEQFAPHPLVGLDPINLPSKISKLTNKGILPSSILLIDHHMGMGVTAESPEMLARNTMILNQEMDILAMAAPLGVFAPAVVSSEDTPKGFSLKKKEGKSRTLLGEIALVTGAASGIGKACVDSLLERGAAVVGLDINEDVLDLQDKSAYFGQVCDLTDEKQILKALELAVRTFGGLDIMVLNAGIFPASCAIDELSLEHWQSVMKINVDANITLLREAYPLLKRAPRYGRVVINGSRNVPAPGPGAATYSASKAALTQLGRVAALEWGKAHIRVNMINPHAVFDTGIWTEDVLESRAAKYGISVEQYKKNNVLGVELASQDVGELVAEMCGPLFSKITGAQVPIDGGSDRVI